MRIYALTFIGIVLLALFEQELPRKVGPEWTPGSFPNSLERGISAKAERHGASNGTNYYMETLAKRRVVASETDDGRQYEVSIGRNSGANGPAPRGRGDTDPFVEVREDAQGNAVEYRMRIGKFVYYDLNGDGMVDGLYDGDTKTFRILHEGRFVDVGNSRVGFDLRRASSPDRKILYVFENGSWRINQPSK